MRGRGEVSNEEWAVLELLLRFRQRPDGRGRSPQDSRAVLNGVLWILRKLRRYKRRWCVERLSAWLLWFRRLVTRYEYHIENFLGMVRLGCMRIMLRYL
jgi:transposase